MKRFLSLCLVLCLCVSMLAGVATAETAESDALWEYEIYDDGVELVAYNGDATDVYVPSFVEDENGEHLAVVKLADGLFEDNDAINSATLGAGITEIGARAFYDCDNLVCIVTNEELNTIGAEAFSGCDVFNSIILLDAVTAIGADAFANCPKVTILCNANTAAYTYAVGNSIPYKILNSDATPEIYTENGVTYYIMNGEAIAISYDDSATTLEIPSVIKKYPVTELRGTFTNSTVLESIILPVGLKTIGEEAFYGCSALTSVNIPDSVTSIGESAFKMCSSLTDITLGNSVISLGQQAFAHCEKLISVDLPGSLTSIGATAFYNCPSLKNITLPESLSSIGVRAFFSCSSLTEITLPESVVNIEEGLFRYCSSLTSVTILGPVTSIGDYAFGECDNLGGITLPDSVMSIGEYAFSQSGKITSVKIPQSVTSIYASSFSENTVLCVYENSRAHIVAVEHDLLHFVTDGTTMPELYVIGGVTYVVNNNTAVAITFDSSTTSVEIPQTVNGYPVVELRKTFKDCAVLESVTLPEGLKTISAEAFYGCENLKSIIIPDSVTGMGEYAFYNCRSLKSVTVGNSVTGIGEYAFYDCESLTSATIGNSVTSIGFCAFSSCDTLRSIVLPDSVTGIGAFAFSNSGLRSISFPDSLVSIGETAFYQCYSLTSITIPDSVTSIGEWAFSYCYALTDVTILGPVTSIGDLTFGGCNKLTSVTLPDSITNIAGRAFSGCTFLTSITLPDSLTGIGANAFSDSGLKNITIPDSVTSIGDSAFSGCKIASVIIPESVNSLSTSSFPATTILCVYENSYAHTFAVENDLLHFVTDGTTTPEVYTQDGITYVIVNGEAIAIHFDQSATEVEIPETVNGYPVVELRGTFKSCKNLNSVTLPNGLRTIGDDAFYACKNLQSIAIPNSVTDVGYRAFGSSGLTEITIPNSTLSLGERAFYACSSLRSVMIPNSVTSIGDSAFEGCKSLSNVTILAPVTRIGKSVFYGCASLKNITLPNSVTSIGEYAFANSGLISITLSGALTSMAHSVFYNCKSLTSVTLPDSVASIGVGAFDGCESLAYVNLSASIKNIYSVFTKCHRLSTVVVPETVISMNNAFSTSTVLCVYENSYAHKYALENDHLYFVLRDTENPEIEYGTNISGTVRYTDGTAVSGAAVEIIYDDGVVKETVTTDANGAYNFTYAEVGDYTIRATDASGNTSTETVSVKRMNAFEVFLAGETDLVLKKGYTVSGTVSGASTVTLTDRDGKVIAQVEANGAFTLENIPNGEYILKAESETGSVTQEITVYNGNVTGIELVIPTNTATVSGIVEVADRDGATAPRNWVTVTIYNSNGVAVATVKSDADGKFTFKGLPIDEYAIVAEVSEMRPDAELGFDRSHKLTGYGHVDVTEAGSYDVGTVVLYEETAGTGSVSGKVTAQGETQDCEVILSNVFRHEIAKYTTKKNGKFTFKNIPDGLYFITAITKSDGMGFGVIVVRNGEAYGDTELRIYKDDSIAQWEEGFYDRIPECADRAEALQYKAAIAEEKAYYDGLSSKEKMQLSEWYVERLEKLCGLVANAEVNASAGVSVTQSGMIVSGEELGSMGENDSISFTLKVEKTSAHNASTDGVKTEEDYIHHEIRDTAGDDTIVQYYEITLEKTDANGNVKQITDIARDTGANGKLRVTMPIPEEYLGYKRYSLIHVHNGETVTLADLDEDPATITFEVDAFSTFVLTASDVERVESEVSIRTFNAAQIRTRGVQGIRFVSEIDKTEAFYSRVKEFGTVLIPTADLEDFSELQIGAVLNGHTVAKVPAVYYFDETEETITFTAVITQITEQHYTTEYTARAYAILNDETVVYADAGASRSVYYVAKRALYNPDESEGDKAVYQAIVDAVEGDGDNDLVWPWKL